MESPSSPALPGFESASELLFTPMAGPGTAASPAADALLGALRATYGEDHVAFAGLGIAAHADPWWFLRHTLEGTRYDLSPLLYSASLHALVPTLTARIDPDRVASFLPLSAYRVGGSLAEALYFGGAGGRHSGSEGSAHELAAGFIGEMTGGRRDDLTVLHSRAAWSGWFNWDVWDQTWVAVDRGSAWVWLLCLTDRPTPHRR